MAMITVQDVDEDVEEAPQRRATANGRSVEAEVHAILRAAVLPDGADPEGLGSWMRRLCSGPEGPAVDRDTAPTRWADLG